MKRGRPHEARLSAACANQKRNTHSTCFMVECICPCHLGLAEQARIKGLRTVPKPGEPGYKAPVEKPYVDDREIEGLNESNIKKEKET